MKINTYSVVAAELPCIRFKHFICFDLFKYALKIEGMKWDFEDYLLSCLIVGLNNDTDGDIHARMRACALVVETEEAVNDYIELGHMESDSEYAKMLCEELGLDTHSKQLARFRTEIKILTECLNLVFSQLNIDAESVSFVTLKSPNDIFIWTENENGRKTEPDDSFCPEGGRNIRRYVYEHLPEIHY